MTALIDMTNTIVNGVTVLVRNGHVSGKPAWECVCKCGNHFVTTGTNIRCGKKIHCDACATALFASSGRTHGDSNSREYITYKAMKSRCYNKSNKRYERYGGRGIKVCDRWMSSYEAFLDDMGRKPSRSHTLERIDVDGDYSPENCVWATIVEQANNRSNNTMIEINGVSRTMAQWSRISGVNRTVLLRRMKRGVVGERLIKKTEKNAITVNGISDSYAGWYRRTGIKASAISARIRDYGWSPEDAVTRKTR